MLKKIILFITINTNHLTIDNAEIALLSPLHYPNKSK